jgi:P-type E1-E2 ATPase
LIPQPPYSPEHNPVEHLWELRAQGAYVAMVGDGLNDVLSLKRANLGIAMQSGSQMTRSAAR